MALTTRVVFPMSLGSGGVPNVTRQREEACYPKSWLRGLRGDVRLVASESSTPAASRCGGGATDQVQDDLTIADSCKGY